MQRTLLANCEDGRDASVALAIFAIYLLVIPGRPAAYAAPTAPTGVTVTEMPTKVDSAWAEQLGTCERCS